MSELETLIEAAISEDHASLEQSIFDTSDPAVVARQLVSFFDAHYDQVPRFLFYRHSVGVVLGAALGASMMVVKVHHWRASFERLAALQRVQGAYAALGVPAPRPLLAPTVLANGIVTVEEFLPGVVADGHDRATLRALAASLQRFIAVGRSITDVKGLESPALLDPQFDLWPAPHSPRFDFDATSKGAEWIDAFGRSAKRRLKDLKGERVIGYLDWRVGNLGFQGLTLSAIYDWDSVGLGSEAFIVGSAAATFASDWSKPNGALPNLDEMRAFVREYEIARGATFDSYEHDVLDAANLLLVAYGARCQHSDVVLASDGSDNVAQSWIGLLRERGERGLLEV